MKVIHLFDPKTMVYPKGVLELIELKAKYKETSGYKLSQRIARFHLSIYIFHRNFDDLNGHIEKQTTTDNAQRLSRSQNREELISLQKETVRLLHNFTSSVVSLIDHTRVLIENLYSKGEIFKKEYEEKKNESFVKSPLAKFFKDLRQYFLHVQIPLVSTVTDILTSSPHYNTAKITISKEELLKYSGWNTLSETYIKGLDQHLDLAVSIREYQELVTKFYTWFEKRQEEFHKEDFLEMDRIAKEIELVNLYIELCAFIEFKSSRDYFLNKIGRVLSPRTKDQLKILSLEKQSDYIIAIFKENKFSLSFSEINLFKTLYAAP